MTIPPDVQKLIDEQVRSGKYETAEDVVTAAMMSLSQQQSIAELSAQELEAIYPGIREKLSDGLEAARAGRLVDGEEFFTQLERELQQPSDRKTA
jgi:antitoxin ParD1/3/4